MAMDLNRWCGIGRLGDDPNTRYMPSGEAVTNLSIACGWKGKDKEGTEWVSLVFFGRLAEIASEYLRKGAQIYVEGRLRTRKWQDKEGHDRYKTEVVGERMQMLGSKPDGAASAEKPARPAKAEPAVAGEPDDEIPF